MAAKTKPTCTHWQTQDGCSALGAERLHLPGCSAETSWRSRRLVPQDFSSRHALRSHNGQPQALYPRTTVPSMPHKAAFPVGHTVTPAPSATAEPRNPQRGRWQPPPLTAARRSTAAPPPLPVPAHRPRQPGRCAPRGFFRDPPVHRPVPLSFSIAAGAAAARRRSGPLHAPRGSHWPLHGHPGRGRAAPAPPAAPTPLQGGAASITLTARTWGSSSPSPQLEPGRNWGPSPDPHTASPPPLGSSPPMAPGKGSRNAAMKSKETASVYSVTHISPSSESALELAASDPLSVSLERLPSHSRSHARWFGRERTVGRLRPGAPGCWADLEAAKNKEQGTEHYKRREERQLARQRGVARKHEAGNRIAREGWGQRRTGSLTEVGKEAVERGREAAERGRGSGTETSKEGWGAGWRCRKNLSWAVRQGGKDN